MGGGGGRGGEEPGEGEGLNDEWAREGWRVSGGNAVKPEVLEGKIVKVVISENIRM